MLTRGPGIHGPALLGYRGQRVTDGAHCVVTRRPCQDMHRGRQHGLGEQQGQGLLGLEGQRWRHTRRPGRALGGREAACPHLRPPLCPSSALRFSDPSLVPADTATLPALKPSPKPTELPCPSPSPPSQRQVPYTRPSAPKATVSAPEPDLGHHRVLPGGQCTVDR